VFFADTILTMNDSSSLLNPQNNGRDALRALPLAEQRRLRQRFETAGRMMEQAVYDAGQVHEMLVECVAKEPENTTFVAVMLRNLRRVSANPPGAKPDGRAVSPVLDKPDNQQDWPKLLEMSLLDLLHTPQDVQTLGRVALACQACGGPESALLYLDRALESAPEDPEIHRQAAQILTSLGKIDDALAHWHQVERVDPRDEQAPRMISMLTLERIRRPAPEKSTDDESTRLQPSGVSEDGMPDEQMGRTEEPTRPRVVPPRTLVLTQRQQLEKAIVDHAEDETLYLKLAGLHLAEGRLYEAQRTLQRAASVTSELHVQEKLEDVNLLRARQQAQMARQRADEQRTVEALELAEKVEKELQQLEFHTTRVRCDRYPNDKSLRFQLGLCYARRGDFREALEPLQAGLEVPEHRAVASLEIGEILQRYRQFPKALQCYRQSAQLAKRDPYDEDVFKAALYRAGLLATQMKLYDSAKQYLDTLSQTDSAYKDVRSRLDKLNEIEETG
jgi:tetratricopeptide (TPR) repeat protein